MISREQYTSKTTVKVSQKDYYQPYKRYDHSTIVIGDNLYLWGGDHLMDTERVHNSLEKMRRTSCIEIFHLPSWSWEQQDTFGKPPLGVSGYACTSIKDCIYYFGGWCGHDDHYHNSLYEMDIKSNQWKELFPTSYWVGPMRKARSGMVSFKFNFEDYLLIVGGIGLPPIVPNPYAKSESLYGEMRTNEQHIFDFSKGSWISPLVIGESPPPCDSFTIEKLSNNEVIMFGGCGPEDNVYFAKLTRNTVHWQKISKPFDPLIQWPSERWDHASSIISFNRKYEIPDVMVVLGGDGTPDCWLLDTHRRAWTEIHLPDIAVDRHVHSLSTFCLGPHCIWLVIFGGRKGIKYLNDTCVVKLVYNDSEWIVNEVMDSEALVKVAEEHRQFRQRRKRLTKRLSISSATTAQNRISALRKMRRISLPDILDSDI